MKDNKEKLLLSKEVDLSFFKDNLEAILAKGLFVVTICFPVVELVTSIAGCPNTLMHTLLRTIGYVGFTFLLIMFLDNKRHKLVWSDILLIFMSLFTALSVIFSLDIDSSIAGASKDLAEDVGQVLGYYVVFFAATHIVKHEYQRLIIIGMLISAVLHTIPAILQRFSLWPWLLYEPKEYPLAYGLTPHHNFYGAIAVIFSALVSVIFLAKKTEKTFVWYIGASICFVAALFSSSRLAWVGIASYFFFIFCFEIYLRKKKVESVISLKKLALLVVTFLLVFLGFVLLDKGMSSQISESASEISGDEVANIGTGRMEIWTVGIYGVKDRLLVGLGLDNYSYAYELYQGETLWYHAHKGHNEYIHTLVTQGLPALIVYVALCAYVILFAVKRYGEEKDSSKKTIIYILAVMVFGYFCQAMFNSSVTNIAVYKWLIMGLLLPRSSQKVIKIFEKRVKDGEQKA